MANRISHIVVLLEPYLIRLAVSDHSGEKRDETIFIYLFLAWGVVILALFLIAKSLKTQNRDEP